MGILYNRPPLRPIRRKLRKEMTKSETILWNHIRNDQLGVRFRRQFSIGNYVIDFYCPSLKLAIEVDGFTHFAEKVFEKDQRKDVYLQNLGIMVKRYSSDDVFNNLNQVVADIYQTCHKSS